MIRKTMILILSVLFLSGSIMAQKVTSKSRSFEVTKVKGPSHPYSIDAKIGGALLIFASEDALYEWHTWLNGTYDVSFRYTRQFGYNMDGSYWGAQLGSTTSLIYDYGLKKNIFSMYAGGVLGYSKTLSSDYKFDINISPNLQMVFEDVGLRFLCQLRPGIWLKKFYLGLEGIFSTGGSAGASTNYGIGIEIGYRFK